MKQEQSLKYLGITITENLTWHDQIENMISKINQRLGPRERFPATGCKTNILYRNHIDYADIIWGDKNNSGLMNSVQTLENKAAKLILDLPPLSSATEALATLH